MDIKTSGDLKWILEVLTAMAETEQIIGEFYKECGELSKEASEFWKGISNAEIRHSANIKTMIEIISTKPERFEKGRPFNIFAVKTFNDGVQNYINRLKNGEIEKDKAFFIARDIEQSLLENRYGEIVKTDDIEFKTLIGEIVSETEEHNTILEHQCSKREHEK